MVRIYILDNHIQHQIEIHNKINEVYLIDFV